MWGSFISQGSTLQRIEYMFTGQKDSAKRTKKKPTEKLKQLYIKIHKVWSTNSFKNDANFFFFLPIYDIIFSQIKRLRGNTEDWKIRSIITGNSLTD